MTIKNSDRIEKLMSITNEEIAEAVMRTTATELGREMLRNNLERSRIREFLRDLETAKEAKENGLE